jgi:hypothetical protein
MQKKLLQEPQGMLFRLLPGRKRLTKLLGAGLLLGSLGAQAQTTVFNETFEGTTNSFTLVNGTVTNQWAVGTAGGNGPTTAGTKAAYVSNDAGVSNAYTLTAASVAHLYRDVTFPANQSVVQVSFDWLANGEGTFDYIQVFLVPTTVTPVAGTQLVSGTAGAVQIGTNINLQPAFGRTSLQLSGVAGTTQRLVFTWRNDGLLGAQPPAVLDNITVTAQVASPISGAYTINSALPTAGTNFQSFTDAANRLNLDGISGPTTITVSGGPYTEQFLLGQVNGTSATSPLVINGGGRTIRFGSTSSNQRAVVQLNGTDYTTVNNLVIDATNNATPGTYGFGVLLTNAADNDQVTNCTVNADIATTSSNFAGIAVSGSTSSATTSGNSANNLTLEGNTINGGYYGITLIGNSTTSLNTGNIVRNNTVRDFYFYGIYAGYQDGARFLGNDVSRPLRTNGSAFYGLYPFSSRGLAIEKNRIHDAFTGNPTSTNVVYAIYLGNGTTPTATATVDVVNNVVYNMTGSGTQYLVYNSGSAYSRIYNNTLSSDDQTTTAATIYGIYSSGTNADIKNNLISITRPGGGPATKYGLYYLTNAPSSNYNDIYVPNGSVGYYTTAYTTLANWQTANSNAFDQNSVSADPEFVAPATGNLLPRSATLNSAATPLTRVTDDINGITRGTTPDIGAYEFTPATVDVAVVSLTSPVAPVQVGARPVAVQVRNNGLSPITTVTLSYTLNGGTAVSQTFTGLAIASGAAATLTFTTQATLVAGSNTIAITASQPNGQTDPTPGNNSLTTTVYTSLVGGAYTINNLLPTGGTNFQSFTAAAAALNNGGITGAVTLTVSNGPYTEQFLLGEVLGTSATSRLTINGGGSTIRFGSNDSNQRAVVQLNGTDYTTVNNLVIDATNNATPGTYGFGVLLTNAADNDQVTNCTVNADIATTSTNFAGIAVSGSTSSATTSGNSANNLTLEGNTVNGGYYGITLYGNSTTSLNTGNIVRNNTVRDFYFYGIYAGYQDGARFLGNDVSRPLRTNGSTFYGLYPFSSRGLAIEKNRIHDAFTGNPTSTSSAYGIYLGNGTTATTTATVDVVNNVVYNMNGNGTQYLVYSSGSASSQIYNNTLSSDNQVSSTSTTYGIYSSGTSADIKNNVISITRPGTGTKYGLYYLTNAPSSNYNDIYVPNGNVGYYTTAYATLANWQTANSNAFDQNSVSADPQFVAPAAGNLLPANVTLNNTGTPLTRVTDDINGITRGTTPDIGAYEFTPVAVDVSAVALVSPAANASCYGAAEPLTVQIRNNGTTTLNLVTNAATVTVVVTPPTGAAQTFTATVSTGTVASNATLNVTLPGTLNMTALGTYSFAVTATAVGDLNTSNNALNPTPTRTVAAPIAGAISPASTSVCPSDLVSLSLSGSANGQIQYQSSTSATGTFTDVSGANSATFTTAGLAGTTYFRAKVSCNGRDTFSNVATVAVTNPQVLTAPSPLSTCAGGTVTLTATTATGVSVRYFTSATGGTAIGTGSSVVSPALTSNTTFYAEAFVGSQTYVGPAAFNSTGQTPQTGGALYFTTTASTNLTNVTVFLNAGQAAGTVTIDLLAGNTTVGTALQTNAFAVPAGPATGVAPYVITLNYPIPTAGQYTLYLRSATQLGLLRDPSGSNTTGYPYTSPSGLVTITASNLSGYYYYFYNLQFGSECAGTRTPIVVNVTPGLVASLPVAAFTSCGTTPYQLAGTIAGTATGALYTTSGTGTFSPNATTLNATYTPSAADVAAGTVTLTLTPTGPSAPCTTTGRVVLTLATPASAAFSYPSTLLCTGSAAVTPILPTGAVAGTFSTTGTGLRLDPVTGAINLTTQISTGTYTVTNTVAATSVCPAITSTTTITISAGIPRPTLSAFALPGGGVQLTTNPVGGVQYQFFVNGVAVGPPSSSFTATVPNVPVNGSYTVVLSVPGGCSSAPSTAVLVTGAAVANLDGVSLRVFPNPTADGQLNVELSGINAKASQLTVLNALGQVVHTGLMPAGTATLDLSRLAAGVYTFRVQTAQGVLTQRLVRQ